MCYVKLINMSGELLSAQIFVTQLCKCVKQFAASAHHLFFSALAEMKRLSHISFPFINSAVLDHVSR